MIRNILENKQTGFSSLTPKLKTLTIINAIEIATTTAYFDQFPIDSCLLPVLQSLAKNNCHSIKLAAKSAFVKLVEKDKIHDFTHFPEIELIQEQYPTVFTPSRKRRSSKPVIESGSFELNFKRIIKIYNPAFNKKSTSDQLYAEKALGGVAVKRHVFELSKLCLEKYGHNWAAAIIELDKVLNAEKSSHFARFLEYLQIHDERKYVRLNSVLKKKTGVA